MGSIDQQIDAAVVLMKARAARLNNRTMDEYDGEPWNVTVAEFIGRAISNLHDAEDILTELEEDDLPAGDREANLRYLLDDLCDAPNLCALALSLHPDRNPGQGGA